MARGKVIIGGGAGYIGSALVPSLIKDGYEVKVIDLLWFGNYLPAGVEVIKKDLFDCQEEDFIGADAFIFLAGLSNDPMAEYSPAKNFVYNGSLPSYLAYMAKQAGVKRFIYASSCSVYGFTNGRVFVEEDPVNSNYPYGISKLQGERGTLQLADDSFSVIAVRQGTVCGVSSRLRLDLIVNTMVKNALVNGVINVNNPDIWRPILGIDDCVQVYHRGLEAPASLSGVFNVASVNHTVGEVAEIVKKELEVLTGKIIEIKTQNIYDMRNYRVDWEKAKKLLRFEPKHKIKDIVKDLYVRLDSEVDLENDNFYNIRVFQKIN